MSDTKGKADSPGPDPAGNPPIDVAHGTESPAAAQGVDFERWYGLATKFVAPATFLTAVLFYVLRVAPTSVASGNRRSPSTRLMYIRLPASADEVLSSNPIK